MNENNLTDEQKKAGDAMAKAAIEIAILKLSDQDNWLEESTNLDRELANLALSVWDAVDKAMPGAVRYGSHCLVVAKLREWADQTKAGRLITKVTLLVSEHYSGRSPRSVRIDPNGPNGGGVFVTLDHDNGHDEYFIGTAGNVLAGELPECLTPAE